jgi:CheY-like chemotaxis protein
MTAENEPQPRILVVDDMPANVRLLEAVLEAAGFAVSSASSSPETLERVVSELPDLVLLDVQMAGMNGYEVCRTARTRRRRSCPS